MTDDPRPAGNPAPGSRDQYLLGKVASPEGAEATSEEFTFWVAEDRPVEKTQIVHVMSRHGGTEVKFHAVVDEVYRRSRRRNVMEEADRFGGNVHMTIPFDSQGLTYATAKILRTDPPVLAPPREESPVCLSDASDAFLAYGVEEMGQALAVGLLKNGGSRFAGPAYIDLDYLLGANGAHLNVNGVAGAATKSSFLMCVLYLLLHRCRTRAEATPSAEHNVAVVPIVLNVKGFDLMWLDRANKGYQHGTTGPTWRQLGVEQPAPFTAARFLAPEQPRARTAVPVGRVVERYSWSLGDVIERGLFPYLFGDEDRDDENFLGLLQDVEAVLTFERQEADGAYRRTLQKDAARTFQALLDWVGDQVARKDEERRVRHHHPGTWRKFYRRLRRVVQEGEGLLVRHGEEGRPLDVTATQTAPPAVIDLQSIHDAALQRFVVAALFAQVSEARTGTNARRNLVYVIVLDELNRWAPKGATDAITRLVERVVAEMRSQGVILFGAQQQASQVSPRVIENCAIRVLGRTGSLELSQPLWGFLGQGVKRRVQTLQPDEKLVYQVNFREPMQVHVPYPPWAMRRDEAEIPGADGDQEGGGRQRFDDRETWER